MGSSAAEAFERDGFVLLRGGMPSALLDDVRRGVEGILALHAEDKLRDARRHQTILDPAVYHRSFLDFLNLPLLNETAIEVIGGDDIFFAELALLVGSRTHDICTWHRDFSDDDPDFRAFVAAPRLLVQYNCALYDDASLWVVPGSHARPTLPAERAWAGRFTSHLSFFDAWEAAAAIDPNVLPGMPGAHHAVLAAGDCLLYNPVLWHAAEYVAGARRATLHGTWKPAAHVERYKALRWGLGHNPWLLEPGYLGDLGPHVGAQLPRLQAAMRRNVSAFMGR